MLDVYDSLTLMISNARKDAVKDNCLCTICDVIIFQNSECLPSQ